MALFFLPVEQSAMVLPCFQQLVVVVRVLVVEEVDTKNNLFFLIFVDIGLGFGVLRFTKTYLLFFSAKHDMKHEIVKKYTTRLTCLFILMRTMKKITDH